MVVRIHPREPTIIMRTTSIAVAVLLVGFAASCKKGGGAADTTTGAGATELGLECDHDSRSNAIAKHTWPYPAEYRDLRMSGTYAKMRLRLRPNHAAFVTATVIWKEGDLVEVLDSEIQITKPRRLVAERDLFVTRKVWSQGVEVEREYLATAKGEVGSFLFYNSQGMCMLETEEGPGWTPCTLEDAFEGLSPENPHACEQRWWVQVQKRKVDKGWMIVDPAIMKRVPPPSDATK